VRSGPAKAWRTSWAALCWNLKARDWLRRLSNQIGVVGGGGPSDFGSAEKFADGPVLDEEMSLAKDSLTNSYVFGFDTSAEVRPRALRMSFTVSRKTTSISTRRRLAAVTGPDVFKSGSTYFAPTNMKIMMWATRKNSTCRCPRSARHGHSSSRHQFRNNGARRNPTIPNTVIAHAGRTDAPSIFARQLARFDHQRCGHEHAQSHHE